MKTESNDRPAPYRHVLVCTDFSRSADHAFEQALALCLLLPGSRLDLLHVVPETDAQFWKTYIYEVEGVDRKAREDIDAKLANYRRQVPAELPFHIEIRIGKDHLEILEYATQAQADLIVIGRRRNRSLSQSLLGDLAEKVCRHAPCAVLVATVIDKG